MPKTLLFWKPRGDLKLTPPEVARELLWGEEVEGLIDLPVKEVLDRLKEEFPGHRETPGLLVLNAGDGRIEATWSWQYLRLELHEVDAAQQQRATAVLKPFGCDPYGA